jgi:predicted secreted Zn-dependent protease
MPRLGKIFRYRILPIFLAIALCGFIVSNKQAIAQNTPNVSIKTNYYDIQGSTAKQLRSQLNQLGVVDPKTGKRFDAYTSWRVSWNYRYRPVNNQCQITQVTVNVQAIYTMPRWNPSANASMDLKNRWNRYITALRQHEDGHKNHGVNAGQDILQTLNNLTTNSCQQIGNIANQKGDAIIKQYNLKDIDYDRLTQHGFTQGAVFP